MKSALISLNSDVKSYNYLYINEDVKVSGRSVVVVVVDSEYFYSRWWFALLTKVVVVVLNHLIVSPCVTAFRFQFVITTDVEHLVVSVSLVLLLLGEAHRASGSLRLNHSLLLRE